MNIKYERLTTENFNEYSLDKFVRHQICNEWIRKKDGEFYILKKDFIENWDLEELRDTAAEELTAIREDSIAYGAFDEGRLIGFASLRNEIFGSFKQYIELKMMHVSEEYRGLGIGKKLFLLVASEAKKLGLEKLYISAHSSVESQAFYKSLGCVEATEIDAKRQANEPADVQMEYILQGGWKMKFNKLIPELTVTDIEITKEFYVDKLGFKLEFEREKEKFIFLSIDDSQFMFEQHHLEGWNTAMLVYPYGRGINFSIALEDLDAMYERARDLELTFYKDISTTRYEVGDEIHEQREFLIQDPDGYLLRFTD